MEKDSFQNKQGSADIQIEFAKLKDWPEYKKLRLEAVIGPDAKMFGIDAEEVEKLKIKSDQEWQEDLSKNDDFILFFRNGPTVMAMGRIAKINEQGTWHLGSGYVTPAFRGHGLGKKMFLARLKEILRQGGKKVEIEVNITNEISIHLAKSIGFQSIGIVSSKGRFWNEMDLDLTDPEVVRRINEVLDAG